MRVPYLIYVIRIELHHTVGLLGLLHRGNRKHAAEAVVDLCIPMHAE
jgi:hypothetical protein